MGLREILSARIPVSDGMDIGPCCAIDRRAREPLIVEEVRLYVGDVLQIGPDLISRSRERRRNLVEAGRRVPRVYVRGPIHVAGRPCGRAKLADVPIDQAKCLARIDAASAVVRCRGIGRGITRDQIRRHHRRIAGLGVKVEILHLPRAQVGKIGVVGEVLRIRRPIPYGIAPGCWCAEPRRMKRRPEIRWTPLGVERARRRRHPGVGPERRVVYRDNRIGRLVLEVEDTEARCHPHAAHRQLGILALIIEVQDTIVVDPSYVRRIPRRLLGRSLIGDVVRVPGERIRDVVYRLISRGP